MQKEDIEKLAQLLALDIQRIMQGKGLEKKKANDRLYEVCRSRVVCKVHESDSVFVLAENDREAERKAKVYGWEVNNVIALNRELIF